MAIYIRIDVSKNKPSGVIANCARHDVGRYFCTITIAPFSFKKFQNKLSETGKPMATCYEAGPRVIGASRQVQAFGFDCLVVALSRIRARALLRSGQSIRMRCVQPACSGPKSCSSDFRINPCGDQRQAFGDAAY